MAKLKASWLGILNTKIATIITCPEEEIGNHSKNPWRIAMIKYSIII
jgi:hypothetical protein